MVKGDVSPDTLHAVPWGPRNAVRFAPRCLFVVVLREPGERAAASHRSRGVQKPLACAVEVAMAAAKKCLYKKHRARRAGPCAVDRVLVDGLYAYVLKPWLDELSFVEVVDYANVADDVDAVASRVWRRLGLSVTSLATPPPPPPPNAPRVETSVRAGLDAYFARPNDDLRTLLSSRRLPLPAFLAARSEWDLGAARAGVAAACRRARTKPARPPRKQRRVG